MALYLATGVPWLGYCSPPMATIPKTIRGGIAHLGAVFSSVPNLRYNTKYPDLLVSVVRYGTITVPPVRLRYWILCGCPSSIDTPRKNN